MLKICMNTRKTDLTRETFISIILECKEFDFTLGK